MLFPFKIVRVRHACRYRAQRAAVLSSWVPGRWSTKTAAVETGMRILRERWIRKVSGLSTVGWNPAATDLARTMLNNCPPTGVITDDHARCCCRPMICPYCYAREYVLKCFLHLERTSHGGTHPAAVASDDFRLIEFAWTSWKINRPAKIDPFTWFGSVLPQKLKKLVSSPHRRDELRYWQPVCGAILHRLKPDEESCVLVRSGLLLVPANNVIAAAPSEYYEVREPKKPTRGALVDACGRAFRYPRELLKLPVRFLAPLLTGMQRARMVTLYGGSKPSKPVSETE